MVLGAFFTGAGGCAVVFACTDKLRLELKNDLKPLLALATNVALIQQTLQAQQAPLATQQAPLATQQATLATLQATMNASLLLQMLGLAATIAVLFKTK